MVAAARRLAWRDVWQQRLAAHSLDAPAPSERLTDVVGAVCGIHAQVAASQLESEARRMGAFYGQQVAFELGHVEPRWHM